MKRWALLLLLLTACKSEPAKPKPKPTPKSERVVQGLEPGQGQRQVIDSCTPCHSTRLIVQNHLSRAQWDETLTWMEEKQKMWPLPSRVREKILDYLAEHQGPVAVARGADTPWAEPKYRPNPIW